MDSHNDAGKKSSQNRRSIHSVGTMTDCFCKISAESASKIILKIG